MEQKINAKGDAAYYFKSFIGLAIMIFFGLLPAPEPITRTGMIVLGQFIGLIYLWTAVDMAWPSIAGILIFGFVAFKVFPNSAQTNGIYEANAQSFGNWCTIFIIGMLCLCEVLITSGVMRRIATWALTRKIAQKNPWNFTFVYLLMVYLVEVFFMDGVPFQLFMFVFAKELFKELGMTEDDMWTKVITIGTTWCIILGYAASPICHPLTILFMGIYEGITGIPVNWVSYMLIAIPVSFVIFLSMFLFLRFVVKPDVSKLEKVDLTKLEASRPGKMGKKEKIILIVMALVIFTWILPGFLSFIAPTSQLFIKLNDWTMVTPMLAAVVFFSIYRVDGKPILNIPKALSRDGNMDFLVFCAGIMMIATAMGEPTTGLSAFVNGILAPIASRMSGLGLIVFLVIVSIVLTNMLNNIPCAIILETIGVPLAMQMGINPFLVATTIAFCCTLGYAIPPAFIPVGICYADPFGGPKYTFRWGIFAAIVSIIISSILIYPLGLIFA
jgi:sodium-dependent dicarboxylate transporter 2/3/5